MPRTIGPNATIETFRRDAKRWLRDVRAGDPNAIARLEEAWPKAPAKPTLRDLQHALALQLGVPSWIDLRKTLAEREEAARSIDDLANEVLRGAWNDGNAATAARIAQRRPEIAHNDLATAVAFGDLAEVRRRLDADPTAAQAPAGPYRWEPLLYLAYSRLPLPAASEHAVEIAGLLLDHGGNPNAGFDDGWGNMFKVLTGVIGLGEGIRPPHPRDRELARLVVDRGADPFDTQALYNDSIVADDTSWLQFLWDACVVRGTEGRWTADDEKTLGGRHMNAIDYLLGNAVTNNHPARAAWLLDHGANPNGVNSYSKQPHLAIAQLHGFPAIAEELRRWGARPMSFTGQPAFIAACLNGDFAKAGELAASHPSFLRDPAPLLLAASQDRPEVIEFLLELGMPADASSAKGQRALHSAAHAGALRAARALLDAGSDVDRRGGDYNATPLGHAVFWKNAAMIDLIAPLSRDVHGLTQAAQLDRLREVLGAEPELAKARNPLGLTPLQVLPDDEDAASNATTILLAHGADPSVKDRGGESAAALAEKRGLVGAAELMREQV